MAFKTVDPGEIERALATLTLEEKVYSVRFPHWKTCKVNQLIDYFVGWKRLLANGRFSREGNPLCKGLSIEIRRWIWVCILTMLRCRPQMGQTVHGVPRSKEAQRLPVFRHPACWPQHGTRKPLDRSEAHWQMKRDPRVQECCK